MRIIIVLRKVGLAIKGPNYTKGLIFEEYTREIKRIIKWAIICANFHPCQSWGKIWTWGFCVIVFQGQEVKGENCSKSNSEFDDKWLYLPSKEGICVWSEDFLWIPDWYSKGKNFIWYFSLGFVIKKKIPEKHPLAVNRIVFWSSFIIFSPFSSTFFLAGMVGGFYLLCPIPADGWCLLDTVMRGLCSEACFCLASAEWRGPLLMSVAMEVGNSERTMAAVVSSVDPDFHKLIHSI